MTQDGPSVRRWKRIREERLAELTEARRKARSYETDPRSMAAYANVENDPHVIAARERFAAASRQLTVVEEREGRQAMALHAHAEAHSRPDHHVGPCSAACRAGRVKHGHRDLPRGSRDPPGAAEHLYRGEGTEAREKREFRARYGSRGDYVYGATVGKVKREREARAGNSMAGMVATTLPARRRRRTHPYVPVALLLVGLLLVTTFPMPHGPLGAVRAQGTAVETVAIVIHNPAAAPEVAVWDMRLTVNSSAYPINANWSNVAFVNATSGAFVPAWVEGNATNVSATTTVWLRMNTSLAGGANVTVDMLVYAPTAFEPNAAGPVGWSPLLGATYGAWDDGALVFPLYDDFKGSTLNAGLWVASMASGAATVNNGLSSTSAQTGGMTQATCGLVSKYQNLTGNFTVGIYGANSGTRSGPFTSTTNTNTCASTANTVVQALDPTAGSTTQYTVFSQTSSGTYATNTVAFTWKTTANYLWSMNQSGAGATMRVNYTKATASFANLTETTVYPGIWLKATSGTAGPWYWVREYRSFAKNVLPTTTFTVVPPVGPGVITAQGYGVITALFAGLVLVAVVVVIERKSR